MTERQNATRETNILIMGADPAITVNASRRIESLVTNTGDYYYVHTAVTPEQAKQYLAEEHWDAIFYDMDSYRPTSHSVANLEILVSHTPNVPVYVFHPNSGKISQDCEILERAVKTGAKDEIIRPDVSPALFDRKVTNITEALHAVVTDPLTGLLNRRAFTMRLNEEYNNLIRQSIDYAAFPSKDKQNQPEPALTTVFIDLDDFKKVNDNYGHKAGDRVLTWFTEKIGKQGGLFRHPTIAGRYGGEEFAVLIPNAHTENQITRRIHNIFSRITTEDISSKLNLESPFYMGLSLGMVTCTDPKLYASGEELIEMADKAMYHSKNTRTDRKEKSSGYMLSRHNPATGTPEEVKII